eukprot:6201843-Pleurochrysis_carterae.AAC.1
MRLLARTHGREAEPALEVREADGRLGGEQLRKILQESHTERISLQDRFRASRTPIGVARASNTRSLLPWPRLHHALEACGLLEDGPLGVGVLGIDEFGHRTARCLRRARPFSREGYSTTLLVF